MEITDAQVHMVETLHKMNASILVIEMAFFAEQCFIPTHVQINKAEDTEATESGNEFAPFLQFWN